MGKRVKNKSRAPQKGKRVASHSHTNVPQEGGVNGDTVDQVAPVVKERKPCAHIENGFDFNKLSEKIGSSDPVRCEDCREGGDRRSAKGKGKQAKKKTAGDLKVSAIWICLACGHYGCGGVGFPTTPQSHAVRHAKQTRHPLAVQWENPHLRWCFPCNMLIPGEKSEESGDKNDVLLDVVKLIKTQSSECPSVDVEDVWFGGGSVTSEIRAEGTGLSGLEDGGGYMVRGLVNLGNTCFFNSVMQNLLAIDKLRDYFLNEEACFGPLSISLKKLFCETKPEGGLKNVINPKSFFGCICSKAPQFRGYQQQDSHELLRCLLDGLSTEELTIRKRQRNASEEAGIPAALSPTFVDAAFGGRISSTICCLECGHTSTVYEPFLDLSLSVPMKKPPSKKAQPVSRAKKTKPPPKRGVKARPKSNKEAESTSTQCISSPSISGESPCQPQSTTSPSENMMVSSGDARAADFTGPMNRTDAIGLESQNSTSFSHDKDKFVEGTVTHTTEPFDNFWLDCLGSETKSDEHDLTSQNDDMLVNQNSWDIDTVANNGSMEVSSKILADDVHPNPSPVLSSVNPWEEEVPLQVQSSEVLLLPYKEESSADTEIAKEEADASSSVMGCGQNEGDFDGFGDLFNETEVSIGPVAGPSLGNNFAVSGFMANSESDPDEVDNTDSPVSVESCLAHFVKPELLSNDNAWECENCSKLLQLQMLQAKKKASSVLDNSLYGDKIQAENNLPSLDEVGNVTNEGTLSYNGGQKLTAINGKVDCLNRTCIKTDQTDEVKPLDCQREEKKVDTDAALLVQSHSSGHSECRGKSLSSPEAGSCSSNISTAKDQPSELLSGISESGDVQAEEDKNIKKVNVKRDATKRLLIDKAPPILTIHLKRFKQDARGRSSKMNGHINFTDILDLRSCMDPSCVNREEYIYRLRGVVEHLGTMRGGHYVAYVRGGRGGKVRGNEGSVWYHASDAHVHQVSFDEVLRCEAYILFYEKISN